MLLCVFTMQSSHRNRSHRKLVIRVLSVVPRNETINRGSQSHDGKRLEYRAYLYELNIFLAQAVMGSIVRETFKNI